MHLKALEAVVLMQPRHAWHATTGQMAGQMAGVVPAADVVRKADVDLKADAVRLGVPSRAQSSLSEQLFQTVHLKPGGSRRQVRHFVWLHRRRARTATARTLADRVDRAVQGERANRGYHTDQTLVDPGAVPLRVAIASSFDLARVRHTSRFLTSSACFSM